MSSLPSLAHSRDQTFHSELQDLAHSQPKESDPHWANLSHTIELEDEENFDEGRKPRNYWLLVRKKLNLIEEEPEPDCFSCMKMKPKKQKDHTQSDGAFERGSVNIPIEEPVEGTYLIHPPESGLPPDKITVIEAPHPSLRRKQTFDVNMYAAKKSAANGLMDLALLMANASQLKHILLTEGQHRFYLEMLIMLITSIVLQVVVGLMMLVLARMKISENEEDEAQNRRTRRADCLNNWVVSGVFVLTIVNVFIASFGLNQTPIVDVPVGKS